MDKQLYQGHQYEKTGEENSGWHWSLVSLFYLDSECEINIESPFHYHLLVYSAFQRGGALYSGPAMIQKL